MPKSYTVDDDYNDSRLDKWFKNKVINLPHSLLEKILRQNKIKVNKKKTKSSYRLQTGDLIEIYDISKFKSVDKLISDGVEYHKTLRPERTYTYSEVVDNGIESDDFKILNYGIEVNNDLLKKLRLGTYSSFFAEFNPATGVFTLPQNGKFNLNDYTNKTKNLGSDPEIPKVVNDSGLTLADMPSRIIASIANIGRSEGVV